jgi:hypothetical protein
MTGPEVTRWHIFNFTWALQGSAGLSRRNLVGMAHSANLPIMMLQIIKDTKGQLPVSQLEMVYLN